MKKTIVFITILLLALFLIPSYAAIPSTLGWYEIPNTKIRPLCPSEPSIQGIIGCTGVTEAWSGGVFDTKRNRLILWGGGHADYFGNEIYALDLGTLSMQRITDPGLPAGSYSTCQEAIAGGAQPNSRHTYQQMQYLANVDKMWVFSGALACGSGSYSDDVWLFDFTTKAWTQKNPSGTPPDYGYGLATAYNPNNGKVLVKDIWDLHYYDPAADKWEVISTEAHSGYNQVGVYDRVNNKFVIVGQPYNTPGVFYYDIDASHCVDSTHASSCSMHTLSTTGGSAVISTAFPGLAWDSAQQKIVAWAGGNTVYYLTPNYAAGTGVWTPVTYSGGAGAAFEQGTFGRWQYSPTSGVFVVYNSVDANAYSFRLSSGTLTLNQDGPVTPEQISIFIPSSLPTTATATLRYRKLGTTTWIIGHPLHRIRPSFADSGMTVEDGFAWVIIGLTPGTSYEVEATVTNGTQNTVYASVITTRALAPAAGAPTKTIAAGSTSAQIQAVFDSAVAGDVIQFANGTYNVNNLTLNRSGTASQPIYIRGQSREGVVLRDTNRVLHLLDAFDIVIENLTLQGSGVDSGVAASSRGIAFYDGYIQERVTIRNTTITGVDMGIIVYGEAKQVLVYDNTLTGNNQWTQDLYAYSGSGAPGSGNGTPDIDENVFWNDDGIRITGKGNAAFNNTLSGFGDALAMADYYESIGVHFFRNDILMTGDDAIEGDYGKRNITFYDNRVHNAMTLVSLDPIWGGPFLAARNIGINIGRGPYKLNNTNTGHFFYNNTVVNPENRNVWGWVQYNNGDQRAWGYQNNILIYRGSGNLLAMEAGGQNPVDFTHNSWYPNRQVWWSSTGGSFTNLAEAYASLAATASVFSGITKRHEADNICESDPFVTDINLGADYHTKISTLYTPNLSNGTAPKNSGAAIANITDGFSGTAPDRGAVISGIAVSVWGDRSAAPGLKGDVNKDSAVDILDVQSLVNHILGIQDYGSSADVNSDTSVDVLDVQEVVNIILG